ncbi:MAG: Hsp20/alpha crystallin family protein [Acidobacteria bacterium]|nr:Hsp20/alpha crystallin family protein [Acidobacteriota bacterium]MBK9705503.1 Hsp20/alpha crystallin family protein [Acidobacteriota bacterium]
MAKQHRLLSDLSAIEQQLSRLVRGPNLFAVEQSNATWTPPVDIFETETSFVLMAEVPGIKSEEIDIKISGGTLTLRGERKWERDVQGEHFHRLESSYGKFERSFSLSERIDADKITAELDRGILRLILPKRNENSGKEIPVRTSGE